MDKIEAPQSGARTIKFRFPQPQRSGLRVVTLTNIDHAYGENVVYHKMNFHAERGHRIVLVGPNGAGKSTLLKLLAGVLPVQSGVRELGHNVKSGYYAQHRVEMLKVGRTVLEEASDLPNPVGEQFIRTVLGSFLFTGYDVFKQVGVLSGGEKSRLALVKLLLDPPNLLLMDEPTTHLDMPSIDALIAALEQFEGTLIFISHDVYFIRKLAKHVLHINAGKLTPYHGDYQYYLDKTSALNARDAVTAGGKNEAGIPDRAAQAGPSAPQSRKDQKRLEAEARNARSRGKRDAEKLVADLEKKIDSLETKQAELTAELEKPETYQNGGRAVAINRELTHVVEDLEKATTEWEQATAKLDDILAAQ
jgi:ATP-binding cassette subfamily F protein 3